ncbi:serine dehydratase subunit alpha family protein [Anaerococcus tetradius]|jgi:hypothetical protein|uniref:UPF0597 protein HMPREF0077_0597 n=2 Tax=Anaerococcus tetradius TaxID=33036 RepID=C2CGI7_9FIRM|nr:L-serine ammonia-lyase, iron-sulfur-dependent, subunit alpha [Anaerococcus tetradius]EEI83251.1 hypothetical protein HMPREF0077_0597 [Anaerococcus tetradius ATCC 35098]KWZ79439.1 hypothetical protein HMPREF3200_00018 [Anaerococcus tetradius]
MTDFKKIIRDELIPATGCTEPIAIAYAAAKARETLGSNPDEIIANLSSNIIKNAKAVTVPGTDGRKGIEISIVAGAFLGKASKKLEVLSNIDKSQLDKCDKFIEEGRVKLNLVKDKDGVFVEIICKNKTDKASVVITASHTNITEIRKNDELIFSKENNENQKQDLEFSFDKVYDFAKTCDYADIKDVLDRQISYNQAIASAGLSNDWGANIGKLILSNNPSNYYEKLVAFAAAGSDARMDGCELPVIINSGSGNQGITTSVPIILYAKDKGFSDDDLYRALIFSNLIALYIKNEIGKLSAYCGVVSASAAVISSIAFINKEDRKIIEETITNALAVNSGIICDGAKSSCAMKIASSLRNASLAYIQAKTNNSFRSGDGIVKEDIDKTIETVARIAKYGMKKTDEVVLSEMINNHDYLSDFE